MRQRRVYIIKDSLTIRALLQALVEQEPRFRVCGLASSAEEALAEMDEARPDIILLDLGLPGMDGLAFMDRMQTEIRDPWFALKVIVVSASTSRHAPICEAAFARGAAACFDMSLASALSADLLTLLRMVAGFERRDEATFGTAVTLPAPPPEEQALGPALRPGPLTLI